MATQEITPLPFDLSDLDRKILSMTDKEYIPHDWENIKEIISTNKLQDFTRYPSQLRLYLSWTSSIKQQYGSIQNFLCQTKLNWTPRPIGESGSTFAYRYPTPLADTEDYKILINDWPYGFDPGVTHIVVWSKTPIATDEETGDVTSESRRLIEEFVRKTFAERLGRSQDVLWFKNWTTLQSVRAVEHFHVLVRGAGEELLKQWTETEGR
ncbi:hypothetical protein BJ878DRAFT_415623 [Calycina marina]|uniref:N-acetylglucosamine-induced protein 1 n=1 Tax=Calycina marina TaxID=1763456 RepID=A0A9P7Z7X6_9HELO|nr:hypothetical protein BJ878DRAFT_415623 [Calycina marina]